MIKRFTPTLMICLFLLASACSNVNPEATQKSPGEDTDAIPTLPAIIYPPPSSEYPAPQVPVYSPPYPEPDTEPEFYATPGSMPTPGSEWGIVTGRMLENGKPVVNLILYLAELLKDDKENEAIASFDRVSSPRAYTDTEGRFVFSNIPPDRYGLVLDIVVDSYLLHHPDTEQQILFYIAAGEKTDLGNLNYDSLPISHPK